MELFELRKVVSHAAWIQMKRAPITQRFLEFEQSRLIKMIISSAEQREANWWHDKYRRVRVSLSSTWDLVWPLSHLMKELPVPPPCGPHPPPGIRGGGALNLSGETWLTPHPLNRRQVTCLSLYLSSAARCRLITSQGQKQTSCVCHIHII